MSDQAPFSIVTSNKAQFTSTPVTVLTTTATGSILGTSMTDLCAANTRLTTEVKPCGNFSVIMTGRMCVVESRICMHEPHTGKKIVVQVRNFSPISFPRLLSVLVRMHGQTVLARAIPARRQELHHLTPALVAAVMPRLATTAHTTKTLQPTTHHLVRRNQSKSGKENEVQNHESKVQIQE